MLKKSFLNRKAKDEQMNLQITSMADIFVIILVFMLKSYSIEGLPYEPTLAVNPPTAAGRFESRDALKLEISEKRMALGGNSIGAMEAFRFQAKDLSKEGTSRMLRQALAKSRGEINEMNDGNRLIVVADQGAPYETIKAVLASAASEGYLDIQLAVSNAN